MRRYKWYWNGRLMVSIETRKTPVFVIRYIGDPKGYGWHVLKIGWGLMLWINLADRRRWGRGHGR